jgi:hypothetical protein
MADHEQSRNEPESNFSFAVSELRHARPAPTTRAVGSAPLEVVHEKRGFDPYDTTGGFDRKNNWSRVGKR